MTDSRERAAGVAWTATFRLPEAKGTAAVVDVREDTIELEFRADPVPVLPIAKRVPLVLSGGRKMVVDTRVVMRAEAQGHVRYEVQLIGDNRPDLGAIFHGRKNFRVAPGRTIDVRVRDEARRESRQGAMHDLSRMGVSVLLGTDDEHSLYRATQVTVEFVLPQPQGDRFMALVGRVRRRELRGSVILYGIEFLPRETVDFQQYEESIHGFLMERQTEMLKRR